MTTYFVIVNGQRQAVELEPPLLGSGGEADIYRVPSFAGCAAKIYHQRPGLVHASREKLEAMLARPPQHLTATVNSRRYQLFAWPTHLIEDGKGAVAGFLMPEVPLGAAVSLQTYLRPNAASKRLSLDDRSLHRRTHVCRNLASAIAEMHRQQHYFVDLKPANIFFFKDTGVVCLVDTDSFSIAPSARSARFPALVLTSEYRAPELLRSGMSVENVANDTQDRFALAVMIFQILTQGGHPFQGVPLIDVDEWNIDLCVREGYYPHGSRPHAAIIPAPWSVHDCLPDATLALFERAFTGRPELRPRADEWRDHLGGLAKQGAGNFTRCARRPDNVLHLHFEGKPCPECRLEGLDAAGPSPLPPPPSAPSAPRKSSPRAAPPSATPDPKSNGLNTFKQLVVEMLAIVVGLLICFVVGAGILKGYQQLTAPKPVAEVLPAPAPTPLPVSRPAAPVPSPLPAPSPTPSPAPPTSPSTSAIQTARAMSNADDNAGISARIDVLNSAINANNQGRNREEMQAIIRLGALGNDDATLEAARDRMRDESPFKDMDGWQRFIKQSRQINDSVVKTDYRAAKSEAMDSQKRAFVLNPWDREATGNFGFYAALNGRDGLALNLATLALSLPRPAQATGRSADWQLVGSMFARQNRPEEAKGAFFVGLAITRNLSGFCGSLLTHQLDYGDSLKAPIDAVFKRIQERGQSDTENCVYPPAWKTR